MTAEALIKAACRKCELNGVNALAAATGISRQTINAWKRRNRIPPASLALLHILRALGPEGLRHAKGKRKG